jgi:hypothetical protein
MIVHSPTQVITFVPGSMSILVHHNRTLGGSKEVAACLLRSWLFEDGKVKGWWGEDQCGG